MEEKQKSWEQISDCKTKQKEIKLQGWGEGCTWGFSKNGHWFKNIKGGKQPEEDCGTWKSDKNKLLTKIAY